MEFKIGTRKSLLAKTQCNQTKQALEALGDHSFSLQHFITEGDQKTDKALWQLEGKDFFTKELDIALMNKEVDLNIHSYKDLGSERPKNLKLQAIPKRQIANDILFINKKTISNLENMSNFVIGTSSPRREINLLNSIKDFIPYGDKLNFSTKILRGNVNTRIEKLKNGDYDAIVLAYAGIERLALSKDSLKILSELLNDTNFLIMPQTIFPSAASQGALAIEVNQRNLPTQLEIILEKIHDKKTASEVSEERKRFNYYGGGCHLAVGIHVKQLSDGMIVIEKGKIDENIIDKIEYIHQNQPLKKPDQKIFIGKYTIENSCLNDQIISKENLKLNSDYKNVNLLITSSHCFNSIQSINQQNCFTFAGGIQTWKKLVKKGIWVNGCGDLEGEQEIQAYSETSLMNYYLQEKKWKVLTNDVTTSTFGETVPCYQRKVNLPTNDFLKQLNEIDIFYWTSYFQYITYLKISPSIKNKIHCCGLGKTYKNFKKNNIFVSPFLSSRDCYQYFKIKVE